MARSKHTDNCGIYKWINLVTGCVLIGQTGYTQGFFVRKGDYLTLLRREKYKGNVHFQRSWTKHTEKNFAFEIIEILPIGDLTIDQHKPVLTAREQFWVDYHRALPGGVYNQIGPVDSPNRGTKLSPERISFLSKINTGRKDSKETKMRKSEASKGKKKTPEHIKNAADARRALPMTERHRAHMENLNRDKKGKLPHPNLVAAAAISSAARKGVPRTPETKAKISEKTKGLERPDLKGVPRTQEVKDKISASNSGRARPELRGIPRTQEVRDKVSKTKLANSAKKKEIRATLLELILRGPGSHVVHENPHNLRQDAT